MLTLYTRILLVKHTTVIINKYLRNLSYIIYYNISIQYWFNMSLFDEQQKAISSEITRLDGETVK